MGWDIVGHERAVELLRQTIARGRIGHAYLLSGPAHVGKRTLAVEYARALNCERFGPGAAQDDGRRTEDDGTAEPPCGHCRRCRLIAEGKHPEVRVVGLQPGHRVIRVGDIEAIQADAALRPADAFRKVYVIQHAELLHPDAGNRLLKTIEEPSQSVVMILTTVDPEATLPTIVSRCQQIRLRPLPRPRLAEYLVEAHGQAADRADLLAALGEGRVGWAVDAVDDTKLLQRRTQLLDDLVALIDGDRLERLQYARRLADRWQTHSESVRETLETWLRYLRDVLLLQAGLDRRIVNVDRRPELTALADQLGHDAISAAVASTRDILVMLEQNVNARLALDVALLDLPRPVDGAVRESA